MKRIAHNSSRKSGRAGFTLIEVPALRQRERAAFTLIEVLATMVLIGIVLPVTHMAIQVSLAAAASARHTSEAAGLAQSKLGEIVALGEWSNTSSGDFGTPHFEYRWTCQNTPRDYGVHEIMLTVYWQDRGKERQINVTTLATEPNTTPTDTAATGTGVTP